MKGTGERVGTSTRAASSACEGASGADVDDPRRPHSIATGCSVFAEVSEVVALSFEEEYTGRKA